MHTRQSALQEWLSHQIEHRDFTLMPLAGDASFRCYYRLLYNMKSYIVMDAPPEKETLHPFLTIGKILINQGVKTPEVFAFNLEKGFALLEDFGNELLLTALTQSNADILYKTAIQSLLHLQQCETDTLELSNFDKAHLLEGMALFPQWFLSAYLHLSLTPQQKQLLQNTFQWLSNRILEQPQVFTHRDYHSRNLMVLEDHATVKLGIIDFQDAMRGPFTYDLVSLLKDCYINWPEKLITQWLAFFYHALPDTHGWTQTEFSQAVDFCGLQRHLRILGTFSRLHLRDGKSIYLQDLPRTLEYILNCTARYPALSLFHHFLEETVVSAFKEKHTPCTPH